MATETTNESAHNTGQNSLTLGLAMLAGLGMTMMIVAAGIGVVGGIDSDSALVGWLFIAGVAMFIVGGFGWSGVVRPWETFDDINQPLYHGHDHDDHEEPGEVNAEQPVLPETTADSAPLH